MSLTVGKLKSLFQQLRSFGLNPSDWRVEREYSSEFSSIQMYHRTDRDFRMHARLSRTSNGQIVVDRLALASI